ncbi:MAG TPA: PBP1A family penicillin-binding protein, partial [Firmicutes bacterium]|nr:PBP1A family penicillin-binding protein [Bacillota bacterium]
MPGRTSYRRRYASIILVLIALAVLFIRITPLPGQVLGSTFFDRNGRIITTTTAAARIEVPLSEMSPYLPKAVVAVEDERFYRHFGVDPVGILRAITRNIRAGRIVEGGSTITQQLAKNMFLPPERTIGRKIREVMLAFYLEVKFTKSEILERYLNVVYLGHGAYGVEMGARTYFGKSARDLTLAESAMLAGLTRGPYYYSPYRDMKAALARRDLVLSKMADLGYITREEAQKASREPVRLAGLEQREYRQAPYFVDSVMREILKRYSDGGNLLYSGGLNVHTTLDLDMQLAAEEAFHEVLDALPSRVAMGEANGTTSRDGDATGQAGGLPSKATDVTGKALAAGSSPSSQSPTRQPQGALVAIDPKTGEIRALIGGRSFRETQFNRATDAKRQPGSAFKPFVYAAALDSGYTAATPLTCEPIYLPVDSGVYSPKDFGKEPYHWRVLSVRDAIVVSCNVIAVKVNYELGPQKGISYAKRMGIESPLGANLSLVLGTSVVTPLEMAAAFCPLANGGYRVRPLFVNSVLDRRGRVIDSFRIEKRRVLDPRTAYILTDIMKGV